MRDGSSFFVRFSGEVFGRSVEDLRLIASNLFGRTQKIDVTRPHNPVSSGGNWRGIFDDEIFRE